MIVLEVFDDIVGFLICVCQIAKNLLLLASAELVAFGRVNSSLPLDLITEVSGKILQGSVPLKEGQRFRKGTLLFKVDNTEANLRLQASKSNFLKDIASILPDLKIDYPDSFELWQSYFNSIDVEQELPELPKP